MSKNKQIKSAKVFSGNDKGLYLLLKSAETDLWELPGGQGNPKESFKTAAKREYKEETGKKPKNLVPLFNHKTKQKHRRVFACHQKKFEPKLSSEHTKYKWATLDDIRGKHWKKLSPRTKAFFKKTSDKKIGKALAQSKGDNKTIKPLVLN